MKTNLEANREKENDEPRRKPLNTCMFGYFTYENDARVLRYAEALLKRGDEVQVICIDRPGAQKNEIIRGVPVHRIQGRSFHEHSESSFVIPLVWFLIHGAVVITLKHLRRRFDVVHVHVPPDFHVFALLLLRLTGAKIVFDIHDLSPELFADKFTNGHSSIQVRLLKVLERVACGVANHVIAANDLWRTTLVSRSVSDDHCTTLINYPGPIFTGRKAVPPPEKGPRKPLVLYPGSLGTHQGLSVGVRAAKILADRQVPLHFAIYGRGAEEESLRGLVSELKLENTVSIHGMLPLEQIADIMTTATVGIVTKLEDGFGGQAFSTKILEFMAIGVPVLVSSTPVDRFYFDDSLVEFFKSGDSEDCAKHLQRLLEDSTLRAARIARGLEFIRENNWDVKKKIYLDLVDRLMGASHAV